MRTHNRKIHQTLPREWQAREALREKGQFWTPEWVARAMVAYALGAGARRLFDPAVGAGAFFAAARAYAGQAGGPLELLGTEVDPAALEQAMAGGLPAEDLAGVELRDFVLDPPAGPLAAIVANPPYIRHHRLSEGVKHALRRLGADVIGRPLDGRAGYHVYFLLRALTLLGDGGRLAFILPADTCEGVFAPLLWGWITRHFRLDAVVTFAPSATPFPGVDTNAVIFLLSREEPREWLWWARCDQPESPALEAWCRSHFEVEPGAGLRVWRRELGAALRTGLSRPPVQDRETAGPVLLDFARVIRGVVTGANEFFVLTSRQIARLELPERYVRRVVARTRDVPGDEITERDLEALDAAGRPTYLLALDREPIASLPLTLQEYLRLGEQRGLPHRPLISTRQPWYRMERRPVPPILFAYLGRRNARFVRNRAGVLPLTCLLCVYPRRDEPGYVEALWEVLRDRRTVANLGLVGKSYGDGAIKVEPRALEQLPLPEELVRAAGLPWSEARVGPLVQAVLAV